MNNDKAGERSDLRLAVRVVVVRANFPSGEVLVTTIMFVVLFLAFGKRFELSDAARLYPNRRPRRPRPVAARLA